MTTGEEFITTALILAFFVGCAWWIRRVKDNREQKVAMALANGRLLQENAALRHRLKREGEAFSETLRQLRRSNPWRW